MPEEAYVDYTDMLVIVYDVARSLFIEKGFENTTMKDIMLASNISVGGLYHHYSSTYDILIDTVVGMQEFRENMFFAINVSSYTDKHICNYRIFGNSYRYGYFRDF